jgi:hypothetical protein
MITNRGGFALVTGLMMVPSQFGANKELSLKIIENAARGSKTFKIENFQLTIEDGSHIRGIIYYPHGWNPEDKSRAVLYHSPNKATISDFFINDDLATTPGEIAEISKCPVIMYDYRGVGLSQDNYESSLRFRPTYHSVVVDGTAIQRYALERFKYVETWGSSLGGAVGTKALDAHTEKFPADVKRLDFKNHDSLTTTSRVVLPSLGWCADWIGWPLGGNLDAEVSMKRLIQRGVKITVLCHRRDPVMPAGARMADLIEALPKKENVRLIYSPQYGHANLSYDMIEQLKSTK